MPVTPAKKTAAAKKAVPAVQATITLKHLAVSAAFAALSLARVTVLFRKVIVWVRRYPVEVLLQIASLHQPCTVHLI